MKARGRGRGGGKNNFLAKKLPQSHVVALISLHAAAEPREILYRAGDDGDKVFTAR